MPQRRKLSSTQQSLLDLPWDCSAKDIAQAELRHVESLLTNANPIDRLFLEERKRCLLEDLRQQ